jgi:taurine transport system permease protein
MGQPVTRPAVPRLPVPRLLPDGTGRWRRAARGACLQAPVAATLVLLLAIWTALSAVGALPSDVLPAPGTVLQTALRITREPYGSATLLGQIAISCLRVFAGFGLATVFGLLVGICMALSPAVRYFCEPILWFKRPVPAFTFITVLIVWFGIGELPKILLVFLAVFAPMTVYTSAAMAAMPPDLADAARSLGASRWQVLVHVRLVTALPDILLGMRVLLSISWTAVMGAELIAAESGLGWMIWQGMRYLDTAVIFVGVFCIALIGAVSDLALALAWRLVGSWAPRTRGA